MDSENDLCIQWLSKQYKATITITLTDEVILGWATRKEDPYMDERSPPMDYINRESLKQCILDCIKYGWGIKE